MVEERVMEVLMAREVVWTISEITSRSGECCLDDKAIENEFVTYFEDLYKIDKGSRYIPSRCEWSPISEEDSRWIERPFEEQEILAAVSSLGSDKAPGPDGFTGEFFKKLWNTLKTDLMGLFQDFFKNANINSGYKENLICLIRKRETSNLVSNFRPISLVHGVYKIVAKVLAERLKKVLPTTISKFQTAFIGGRQIVDPILIANEMIDEKRRNKEKGWVIKIDLEKAYDMVDWQVLIEILKIKGFDHKWCTWIESCISETKFSILLNGKPRGRIKAFRGLRQGDPLSPFLFTVIGDVLSRLLSREMEEGNLMGFCVGKDKVRISHLQFADDTILFCDENDLKDQNLKQILNSFEDAVGLKINWNKSLVSGVNIERDDLEETARKFGCIAENLPISYLGMPLGGNPRKEAFWRPIEDRILKRLSNWSNFGLSKGGRLILIQSVLTNLPTYFMSVFKMPNGVVTRLERYIRQFLWSSNGKNKLKHLINWDRISIPLCLGGLGIGKLKTRNEALLSKWLWRYPEEKEELWRKVIDSIYGVTRGEWRPKVRKNFSLKCPWISIAKQGDLIEKHSSFSLGRGTSIRFWEDKWLIEEPLMIKFPRLYNVTNERQSMVDKSWDSTANIWNVTMRRDLNEEEIEDFCRLMEMLHQSKIGTNPDARKWLGGGNGGSSFSVKSLLFVMEDKVEKEFPNILYQTMWKSGGPKKVNFFVWEVILKGLNTTEKIQRKCPNWALSPSMCALCGADAETVSHIMFRCIFSRRCWEKLLQRFNIRWAFNEKADQNCRHLLGIHGLSKQGGLLWLNGVKALLWQIWCERNERLFNNKSRL